MEPEKNKKPALPKPKSGRGGAVLNDKRIMIPIISVLIVAVVFLIVLIALDATGVLYGASCEGKKQPGDKVVNSSELLDGEIRTSGDYQYRVFKDGTAELYFYVPNFPTELSVPSEIDGYPVTAIGDECFFLLVSLVTVNIPEGITYIGESAFEGCGSLLTVSLPSTLTAVGNNAFKSCPSDIDIKFSGDPSAVKIGEGNDVLKPTFSGN